MLDSRELARGLKALGLDNRVVCLHSSLKSFGPLQNGPFTIIDAFTESGCTLIVPAFFYQSVVEPGYESYRRNGMLYRNNNSGTAVDYDNSPGMIDKSMGALPKALLSYKGAVRSEHPVCSFAAIGPLAQELMGKARPLDVYGHYESLYKSGKESSIVLAGVNLTRCTPIHFAESKAGRRLFRRWARSHSQTVECEVGGCSEGFEKLAPVAVDIERRVKVGDSTWRIYDFKAFIDKVAANIQKNPEATHCGDPGCLRCIDSLLGGPIIPKLNHDS